MESETSLDILCHFNKRYRFKSNESWTLPSPDELWVEADWTDEKLLAMKDKLNTIKNQLNDKERGPWSDHTQSLNPTGTVVFNLKRRFKPQLCTQAWAKCFEIMANYEKYFFSEIYTKTLNSIHLCEAPGAFITALNHFIYSRWPKRKKYWKWIATTLNPYHEGNSQSCMINDDRFLIHTIHNWEFGMDNTGDIMNKRNLDKLEFRARALGEISLITADGSIGCHSNPSEQEGLVSRLHFCEAITAIHLLKEGGNFVIKMFTFFESCSISLLYLINCVFKEVHLFKPSTSKEGNSEVYVICIGLRKEVVTDYSECFKNIFDPLYQSKILLHRKHIPEDFILQVYESSTFFMEKQIDVIRRNVFLFGKIESNLRQYYDGIQSKCLYYFLKHFNVGHIDENQVLVPKKKMRTNSPDLFVRDLHITYNGLLLRKSMKLGEKFQLMEKELFDLVPEEWDLDKEVFKNISFTNPKEVNSENCLHLDMEMLVFGKPFASLQSSRFTCQSLINLWNELIDETGFQMKYDSQMVSNIDELINECCLPKVWILDFSKSENSDLSSIYQAPTQKVISLISILKKQSANEVTLEKLLWIEALLFIAENVGAGDYVILVAENLFTRFIVGCFYILINQFEEVHIKRSISLSPLDQRVLITAGKYQPGWKELGEFLSLVRQTLKTEERDNCSVLEIIPVQQLIWILRLQNSPKF